MRRLTTSHNCCPSQVPQFQHSSVQAPACTRGEGDGLLGVEEKEHWNTIFHGGYKRDIPGRTNEDLRGRMAGKSLKGLINAGILGMDTWNTKQGIPAPGRG